MTAQSRIKAKDEMLVPNTALKERPEPGSERSFPEIEAAAASNGHKNREEEAASKPSRHRSKRKAEQWTACEQGVKDKGAKALYFLMFWAHQTMPHEPGRVRRAGYFQWGKDIRQL